MQYFHSCSPKGVRIPPVLQPWVLVASELQHCLAPAVSAGLLRLLSHTGSLLQSLCFGSYSRALSPILSHLKTILPQGLSTPLTCIHLSALGPWSKGQQQHWLHQGEDVSCIPGQRLTSAALLTGLASGRLWKKTNQADFNSFCPDTCISTQNEPPSAEEWKHLADNFLFKLLRN